MLWQRVTLSILDFVFILVSLYPTQNLLQKTPTLTIIETQTPFSNTPLPTEAELPISTSLPNSSEDLALQLLSNAQSWEPVGSTRFDTVSWPKDSVDETSWNGKETITSNGTYLVNLNNTGDALDNGFWIIPILEQVSDFYLSVEGKLIEGRSGNSYGLIFRSNGFERPAYIFRIFEQAYDIQINDYEWKELSGKTPSPCLLEDEFNRITVIAQDSEFYFYINGKFVHHITDDQISRGNVGLRISVRQGIEQTVEFDNFELRVPK